MGRRQLQLNSLYQLKSLRPSVTKPVGVRHRRLSIAKLRRLGKQRRNQERQRHLEREPVDNDEAEAEDNDEAEAEAEAEDEDELEPAPEPTSELEPVAGQVLSAVQVAFVLHGLDMMSYLLQYNSSPSTCKTVVTRTAEFLKYARPQICPEDLPQLLLLLRPNELVKYIDYLSGTRKRVASTVCAIPNYINAQISLTSLYLYRSFALQIYNILDDVKKSIEWAWITFDPMSTAGGSGRSTQPAMLLILNKQKKKWDMKRKLIQRQTKDKANLIEEGRLPVNGTAELTAKVEEDFERMKALSPQELATEKCTYQAMGLAAAVMYTDTSQVISLFMLLLVPT